jgi:hypothetical protein
VYMMKEEWRHVLYLHTLSRITCVVNYMRCDLQTRFTFSHSSEPHARGSAAPTETPLKKVEKTSHGRAQRIQGGCGGLPPPVHGGGVRIAFTR